MRRPLAALLACTAASGLIGCQRAREISHDLLPRTHTVSTSPNGRTRAFVRQHLNPDPPDDHLYIVSEDGRPSLLMALAPDQDWCRTVVWSPDSRKVGFLVNDERLAIFDVGRRELEVMLPLVTGGSQEARSVTIDNDGLVSFDRVQRAAYEVPHRTGPFLAHASQISRFRPGSRQVTAARVIGRDTVRVPRARLLIQVRSDDGRAVAVEGWARLQARDRRQVHLQFASGADGLVRLASFDPGPFPIVEVGRRGSTKTTVLRNVDPGQGPHTVTIY